MNFAAIELCMNHLTAAVVTESFSQLGDLKRQLEIDSERRKQEFSQFAVSMVRNQP